MSTKYSHLFQIDVLHSYFSDGLSPTLQIQPTPVSQRIMKNHDLRMAASPSGVKIYQGFEDQGTDSANSKIDAPIVLSFFLKSSDPLFWNYTQIDVSERASKIFFTNTLPSEADGVIPVFPANKVTFTSFQPTIHFSSPAEGDSLTVSLYNIAGEKILDEVPSPEDATTGTFQLAIPDGTDEGELLLNLETEDGQLQKQSLYVLSHQALLETFLGILQIAVLPSVAQALLDGQGPIYQLSFSPRETIWRYYLISSSSAFDQFKLFKNGEVLADVTGPETVQLPNGQEAQVMTLQSPIALQQRPGDRLEMEVSSGSQGPFKIPLPSASADRIALGQDENGQQVFYSDIYVYL
jgi:hypothetical protein